MMQHKCCCTRIKSKNTKTDYQQGPNKSTNFWSLRSSSSPVVVSKNGIFDRKNGIFDRKNGIFDRKNDKGAVLKLTKHADQ